MMRWELLILYPVLATALYYLGARARITYALWSRYPPWLDHWASCSACSGAWYTAVLAMIFGWWRGWEFFGLSLKNPAFVVVALLWGTVTTPLLAYLHTFALVAMQDPSPQDPQGPSPPEDQDAARSAQSTAKPE